MFTRLDNGLVRWLTSQGEVLTRLRWLRFVPVATATVTVAPASGILSQQSVVSSTMPRAGRGMVKVRVRSGGMRGS